ncbi:MAG: cobaltochelatase CobT-related protein [Alphaproteobacteria bacterium]
MLNNSDDQDTQQTNQLKQSMSAAARAISANPRLEVVLSVQGIINPNKTPGRIRAQAPAKGISKSEKQQLRGILDRQAVYWRHHQQRLHHAMRPLDELPARLFDQAEDVRCQALACGEFQGVAHNLKQLMLKEANLPLTSAEISPQPQISDYFPLLLWQELTGLGLPQRVNAHLALIAPEERGVIDRHITSLRQKINHQENFGQQIKRLLQDLGFIAGDEASHLNYPQHQQEGDDQQHNADDNNNETQESSSASTSDGREEKTSAPKQEEAAESDGDSQDDLLAGISPRGENFFQPPTPQPDGHHAGWRYQIFTQRFDEVVGAETLADAEEMERLHQLLDQQLLPFKGMITRMANRLQRQLMARQSRGWLFDCEEGLLDAARLARIVADPTLGLAYKQEKSTEFRDTVVSLLIDNSGSMRGRPITIAAISADILARTLERCGVKVEILGFTTKAWKGGQAREQWLQAGKPIKPGRLNDLRHIIYKAADTPWRRAQRNLGLMLREGILKENIDGEALLWAVQRLEQRSEQRRILMVISDGAPVDDSTLSVNNGNYLEKHLRQVVEQIEEAGRIELLAIGIQHDVSRYYKKAVTLQTPEQLGGAMLQQLSAFLV